jgi:hypothetical protein
VVVLKHMPGTDGDVIVEPPKAKAPAGPVVTREALAGPFVVTRKDKVGLRGWNGAEWVALDLATTFSTLSEAEESRPARSKVLLLEEALASPAAVRSVPRGESDGEGEGAAAEVVAEPGVACACGAPAVVNDGDDHLGAPVCARCWTSEPTPAPEPEPDTRPAVGSIVVFVIPKDSEQARLLPEHDFRAALVGIELEGVVDLHKSAKDWLRVRYAVTLASEDGGAEEDTVELRTNIRVDWIVAVRD